MQVTVRFCSVPPQFRERKPWGWSGASHLSFPSTNHTRGLAARRLFRVPHTAKALYIYKHPCLLRDSNPVPTATQPELLTTIPVGRHLYSTLSDTKYHENYPFMRFFKITVPNVVGYLNWLKNSDLNKSSRRSTLPVK
ncbi:hypothetical protein TNCV_529121 [Trichonephila clavipes]|nr:hypothetical protein TNCV_529121 [Trichonephila clavipes]